MPTVIVVIVTVICAMTLNQRIEKCENERKNMSWFYFDKSRMYNLEKMESVVLYQDKENNFWVVRLVRGSNDFYDLFFKEEAEAQETFNNIFTATIKGKT